MEPLKEMFNKRFYELLALEFSKVERSFKGKEFISRVTKNLEELSLNQRMRNTSVVLKDYLPNNYQHAVGILKQVIPSTKPGYTNLLFPDFVSQYGLSDFETSLDALEFFTQFGSSEFAIREFLKVDFNRTIKVMYQWANDSDYHVRRLASEGSRPRLPWSFKLDEVIRNPSVTKPILDALQADKELYVRKSVANHLNDISKENPDYMLGLIKTWNLSNPHSAWIVKHASRTLIKKGNADSLAVFSFEKNPKITLEQLKLKKTRIKLGEALEFDFTVRSQKNSVQKLAVDYLIHYRKKSGELSPKVFKLTEINLPAKQKSHIAKKQVLKDFTTRKHFAGTHILEIQINGKRIAKKEFDLVIK